MASFLGRIEAFEMPVDLAGVRIRNAEARGSIPLCSTNNSRHSNNLSERIQVGPFSHVANMWTEITALDGTEP